MLSSVLFWDIIGSDLFKFFCWELYLSLWLFFLLFNVNGLILFVFVDSTDDEKDDVCDCDEGDVCGELGSCSEKNGGGGGNFKYNNKSLLFDLPYLLLLLLLFLIYLGVVFGGFFKWKDAVTDFICVCWLLILVLLFNLNPFDDPVSIWKYKIFETIQKLET